MLELDFNAAAKSGLKCPFSCCHDASHPYFRKQKKPKLAVIPLMRVGPCKIGLCKKGHLTPAAADSLFEGLTWLHDKKLTDNEKNDPKNKVRTDKCHGSFKRVDCPKTTQFDTAFWVEDGEKPGFCSVKCMLNYVVLHFCKKGQAPHSVGGEG